MPNVIGRWFIRAGNLIQGDATVIFAEFEYLTALIPLLVFAGIVLSIWAVLTMISARNSRAQERLARLSRPASMSELDITKGNKEKYQGLVQTAKALASPLMPQSEKERSALRTKLANAGFRSDGAVMVYSGIRFASLLGFFLLSVLLFIIPNGITGPSMRWVAVMTGIGFYLPSIVLWWIRRKRQEAIFLS